MSYKSGEIYFVREKLEDGTLSSFVKIGLVNSPRTSSQRLLEHQTGNPRLLILQDSQIVTTPAVNVVEAQLHRRYASKRIGGEWFRFENDSELQDAVGTARELSEQVAARMPALLEAERLKTVKSEFSVIPASEEAKEFASELLLNQFKVKLLLKLETQLKELLGVMVESGTDVADVANIRQVSFKPKFDEAAFLADFPELAQTYQLETKTWNQRFLFKLKPTASLEVGDDFSSELSELEHLVSEIAISNDLSKFSETSLRLTELVSIYEWQKDLAEAELKVLTGINEQIIDICSWKRSEAVKTLFDLKAFMTAQPDLYLQYLTDGVTKEYVYPAKGSKRKS